MQTAEEPRSIIETKLTHGMHRAATTLLAEAAARSDADATALAVLRDFLVATLHHHHQSEDNDLWPLIEEVQPGAAEPLNRLRVEHEALEVALNALSAAPVAGGEGGELATAAAAVRDLVHRHLDNEEPLLFPALRDLVSPQSWDTFAQRVIASTPPVGASLLIGFFDEVGSPDEVELMVSVLPAPAQEAVPAMRAYAAGIFASLRAA